MDFEVYQTMPLFNVKINPGDNPKNEYLNKRDYQGEHDTAEAAVAAWKSVNGLDGIGVANWPIEAVAVQPVAPAAPAAPEPAATPAAPEPTKKSK